MIKTKRSKQYKQFEYEEAGSLLAHSSFIICKRCNISKLELEFDVISNKSTCRKCLSDIARKKIEKNYVLYLWKLAKSRAKNNGLEFDITLDDIVIPIYCPILGLELVLERKNSSLRRSDNSCPTIDRVDNDKGYVKTNIEVISWRANRLKSDGKLWEFERIVDYIRKTVRH